MNFLIAKARAPSTIASVKIMLEETADISPDIIELDEALEISPDQVIEDKDDELDENPVDSSS